MSFAGTRPAEKDNEPIFYEQALPAVLMLRLVLLHHG